VETGEHNKLHYTPSALILSPTMELTIQLYREVLKLTYRTPIVPAYAGCHILIATPLRLLEMMVNKDIIMTKCNFLVIDEIDQMLDTGFIPQAKKIEKKLPDKIQRTTGRNILIVSHLFTAMFSATFEEKLKQLASSFLRDNYIKVKITRNIPPYLKHEILWIDDFDKDDKLKELLNDLLNDQGNKIIVFANTKDRCNRIAEFLGNENFKVLLVHGNLSAVDRLKNLRKFVEGKEIKILIASDVLSRGTDIKDISHVINYDSPEKLTTYIHRVGRTARMGKEELMADREQRTNKQNG
uniref:RNA helicase n=1 Tax=Meloidogyne javanica TaxID=6303 RepID=A0A915LGE8_MELJA